MQGIATIYDSVGLCKRYVDASKCRNPRTPNFICWLDRVRKILERASQYTR